MQLYSVYFTMPHIVTKYDKKGKVIDTYTTNISQVIHALPLETAKQYANCDNYRREPYVMEDKSTRYSRKTTHVPISSKQSKSAHPVTIKRRDIENAARTGDLSAALNR